MAYNTPETVADYLARFQTEITHRGKGTFTPDHVKYSLTIASGGKDFFTTFESNPHVHGEPTITQVFGALASNAMVVRDYGMDEFVDEFCDGMKPSAAIRESLADEILNDLSYDEDYAPPLVTWNSPSDALLRNTRKRKGRSLTTSPPANGVCILSTPESVTVSMVA